MNKNNINEKKGSTLIINDDSINSSSSENLFSVYGMDMDEGLSLTQQNDSKPPLKMNENTSNTMQQQNAETNQNLDLLLRNAAEIDDKTKDLLMRNRSLIQQLFPSRLDRMVMTMQRNTIQHAMEFRIHLYKLSTEFRLEALREKYNAALMSIRAHYRIAVYNFMMDKLSELHHNVNSKQRWFLSLAKSKVDNAKQLKGYPTLQSRYLNMIEREAEGFLNFLDKQVADFESIIDERIERFK